MSANFDYSVNLIWSREDEAYIAAVPELPGCMADGETMEEALQNVREVARQWVEVATEDGRRIPQPMSFEDLRQSVEDRNKQMQMEIQKTCEQAVSSILPKALSSIFSDAAAGELKSSKRPENAGNAEVARR